MPNFHRIFTLVFSALATVAVIPAVIRAEAEPPMMDITRLDPTILVDMRYATPQNFTRTQLYPVPECLLCQPAAERLVRVQKNLLAKGLGLKIWDCYRPLSVQKKLWAILPDDRYVANPAKGSRHNRGASIDLTLVDQNGHELAMPTGFDEFGERAHRDFMDLPANILKNRATLQTAMESEGFIGIPTEWWHFDDPQWINYAVRDEPLGSPGLSNDIPETALAPLLAENVQQIILVLGKDWAANTGVLRRFEKTSHSWMKAGEDWPVGLGARGLAWGRGLHSFDLNGPIKKETDKRTPAGAFKVGSSYGPSASAPAGVNWPYHPINEKWVCVDDVRSSQYNRVFEWRPDIRKDWNSAETMARTDHLYKWVINIEQNFPDVKSGCGSCIFFHVWRKTNAPTDGCVAMDEAHIVTLLKWLQPAKAPCVVILPQTSYDHLKNIWQIP